MKVKTIQYLKNILFWTVAYTAIITTAIICYIYYINYIKI